MQLKSLQMINFRHFKNQTISFGKTTSIYGKNGTGKSSIAAAFFWLLFGKDEEDRENFEIKPRDLDGETSANALTEVIGIFEVDGKSLELKRTFSENWVKPRGETEKVFKGNEGKRYIDGIDVGVKEFDERLEEISRNNINVGVGKKTVSISVLKLLTNPKYFNELLNWTERKSILFELVTPICDKDIIASDSRLTGLDALLNDESLESFVARQKPKLTKLDKEIREIPVRVEELQRNMPDITAEQIKAAGQKKFEIETGIENLERELTGMSVLFDGYKKQQERVFVLERECTTLKNGYMSEYEKKKHIAQSTIDKLLMERNDLEDYLKSSIALEESKRKRCSALESELAKKRERVVALKGSEFTPPSEDEFICPTCRRALEPGDIESKTEELRANFNMKKSDDVLSATEDGKATRAELEACAAMAESAHEAQARHRQAIKLLDAKIEAAQAELENIKIPCVETTPLYLEKMARLEELKAELSEPATSKDEITQRKKALGLELDECNKALAMADEIARTTIRIEELCTDEERLNQEKANIEKQLNQCEIFTKLKVSRLEDNISGIFKHTKIKLIDVDEKGRENECCTATLNGVNYESVNTAGQAIINLDIVNALSKAFGVVSPVFIDNREGVNNIIETGQQVVNLFVTENDEKLRVEVL